MSQIMRRHIRQTVWAHKALYSLRDSSWVSWRKNTVFPRKDKAIVKNSVRMLCHALRLEWVQQFQCTAHKRYCTQTRWRFRGAYRYPALCCVFSVFRCNASHGSQRTIQAWTIGKSCDPPKEQRSLNKSTALSGGAFVMLSVSHVRNFVRKFAS